MMKITYWLLANRPVDGVYHVAEPQDMLLIGFQSLLPKYRSHRFWSGCNRVVAVL